MTPRLSAPLEWFLRVTGSDPLDVLAYSAMVSTLVVFAWAVDAIDRRRRR